MLQSVWFAFCILVVFVYSMFHVAERIGDYSIPFTMQETIHYFLFSGGFILMLFWYHKRFPCSILPTRRSFEINELKFYEIQRDVERIKQIYETLRKVQEPSEEQKGDFDQTLVRFSNVQKRREEYVAFCYRYLERPVTFGLFYIFICVVISAYLNTWSLHCAMGMHVSLVLLGLILLRSTYVIFSFGMAVFFFGIILGFYSSILRPFEVNL